MTREERFKEAQKKREEAKKNSGAYRPLNLPDFQYVTLAKNSTKVLRFVGESLEMREKPTDPILVERSLIKADDDSYFTCIWSQDADWPLRKLMRKLAKYEYNDETRKKEYANQGCPLLKRFLTNDLVGNMYDSGMQPRKFVLFNVIDRMDSWCVDNKHTKMLAWDANEKDGKTFYSPGMTGGMYNEIWDTKCTEIGHHFEEVDFVIHRYSEKTRPNEKTNYVIYWEEEKTPIKQLGIKEGKNVNYYEYISVGDLTEQEMNYERYPLENIPFISMVTPAGIILNKLGKFIMSVDEKYDTKFYDEFVEMKKKEIEDFKAKLKEDEKSSFMQGSSSKKEMEEESEEEMDIFDDSDLDDELPGTVEEEPVEAKKEEPKVARRVKKEDTIFTPEAFETFGGLDLLDDEEKKLISKIDVANDKIYFTVKADSTCGDCENDIPEAFAHCPYCGAQFE